MIVSIPIKTVSEANAREHYMTKATRAKRHRAASFMALHTRPKTITLTRVGVRKLDSDNLQSSLKATRDGIADWLGEDDGSDSLTWVYKQRGGAYAVEVEIEMMEAR